jgi:quercetin dioxygenase-like cupin family protein
MTITRIYADAAGESHFEVVEIPLSSRGIVGDLSEAVSVSDLVFRENEAGYDWDFHHAPARQYIVLLDGAIEIETSDGEKRQFRGGDILLVEDIWGKGHRTRHIEPMRRRSLFIKL